jgi:hypothetical protein
MVYVYAGNENSSVLCQMRNLYFCVMYDIFAHDEMDGVSSVTKSISQKICFLTCLQNQIIIDSASYRNRKFISGVLEKGQNANDYVTCIFIVFY